MSATAEAWPSAILASLTETGVKTVFRVEVQRFAGIAAPAGALSSPICDWAGYGHYFEARA